MEVTPNQFGPSYQSSFSRSQETTSGDFMPLIEGLRQMSRMEMQQIDKRGGQAREKAQSFLDQLAGEFKQTTTRAIAAASITAADLDETNHNIFIAGLNRRVAQSIQDTGRTLAACRRGNGILT